ncbi:hypothetical protein D3C81_2100890 [compost metagenome]
MHHAAQRPGLADALDHFVHRTPCMHHQRQQVGARQVQLALEEEALAFGIEILNEEIQPAFADGGG